MYTGLSVLDETMYAADIAHGRILAINLNTSAVTVLYQARDDLQPYTVAAGQLYIYFSAWNRKLVCVFFGDCNACNILFAIALATATTDMYTCKSRRHSLSSCNK